ncbi:MAG: hypothetical protein MJZ41_07690 [Bacteroidaceae bacterium]|nr:hypothetical protein [Bacteroidaceae bacterium]
MITEKIHKIKYLREQKAYFAKKEYEQSRPIEFDQDKIPNYFSRFNKVSNPSNKDNVKMFVFLMFYIYSPASCVGRGVKCGLRKNIAKLLHISNSAVSQQFSDAKVLYEKHTGFRLETDRIYYAMGFE